MSVYKLHFLDLRGSIEYVRYIFAYCNVKFEDCRCSWADFRKGGDSQKSIPMPLGNLASLELPDNKCIGDPNVIGRYLASEFNIAGKSKWDKVYADMVVAKVADLLNQMHPVIMAHFEKKDNDKVTEWAKFKENHLNTSLKIFTDELNASKSGWFSGNELTWADLRVAEFFDSLKTYFEPGLLDNNETLKKFVDKVHEIPSIKSYVQQRKATKL